MTSNRREPFFILSVVLCAFLLLAAYAHIAKAQSRVQTRIVSNVELVQVPIIVFDAKGAIPTDLKKSDFRIWEDGVEQHTVRLDRERVAVSFIVVADVSGSMTKKIPFVQEAALSLLDPLEPEDKRWDEYSVLSVGRRSKLLLSFTHDQAEVQKEMPQLLNATDESTALFDGVWLGVSTAEERARNKHRAMVVITDGGDNHSRYKLGETKRLLEEADMPVFAVMAGPSFRVPSLRSGQGFPDQFPSEQSSQRGMPRLPIPTSAQDYIGPAERRGPHNMKVLTEASGGACSPQNVKTT